MIRIKGEKKEEKKVQIGVARGRRETEKDWTEDPTKLMATVRTWERQHASRCNDNRKYARLYYAKPVVSNDTTLLSDSDGKRTYDVLRRDFFVSFRLGF